MVEQDLPKNEKCYSAFSVWYIAFQPKNHAKSTLLGSPFSHLNTPLCLDD
jgi:hypothetical protein